MFSFITAPFAGLAFWLTLGQFAIISKLLEYARHKQMLRNTFMVMVSILILGSIIESAYFVVALILLALVIAYAGRYLTGDPQQGKKKILTTAAIVFTVCLLCYFKYSVVQTTVNGFWTNLRQAAQPENKHIFFLGISYFSFKFIHFLVDCYNRKIREINPLVFLNYILFFPCFFSGPINRYKQFADDVSAADRSVTARDAGEGFKRIINGLFKKVVLANSLYPFSIVALDLADPTVAVTDAILGIYVYMLFIYFDFSGYTDMAIGSGRLVGIHLPENFNYPFFKRNLQQFWANWHMSLTTWLTKPASGWRGTTRIARRWTATSAS